MNESSQLVALTVQHENPELEQRKVQLLEQEEELKLQLAQTILIDKKIGKK